MNRSSILTFTPFLVALNLGGALTGLLPERNEAFKVGNKEATVPLISASFSFSVLA